MRFPLHITTDMIEHQVKNALKGNKRYPMVLMLEPLYTCNLACLGCSVERHTGKLSDRLSLEQCLKAVDDSQAPGVSICGGEPTIYPELPDLIAGIIERRRHIYLCTNALLLDKKIDLFEPSPYFAWTIHLDGEREDHDHTVCQSGVYDRAVAAIKLAKARGFRVNINSTLFDTADPERIARFFDDVMDIGIDGITVSPGYAYERAPDQEHFLNRRRTKELFREIFKRDPRRRWSFNQSSLFLDFLAGNQSYHCTPWGNPTRNYFGWQRPCYLLGEGYAKTFKELMEETDWDSYGTGNYEKCANCMVHSGYEATAVMDSVKHPVKAAAVALRGFRTEGEMAPEIPIDRQRPAEYVFSRHVEEAIARLESRG
jgi:hopanoid biosynthesis associated radical SAM protein HpnH